MLDALSHFFDICVPRNGFQVDLLYNLPCCFLDSPSCGYILSLSFQAIRNFSWPMWLLKTIVWSWNNNGLSSSGCILFTLQELRVLDLLLWSLIWSPFTMQIALLTLTLVSGTWEAWENLLFSALAFSVYWMCPYTIQQQDCTFLSHCLSAADVVFLAFIFPAGLNTLSFGYFCPCMPGQYIPLCNVSPFSPSLYFFVVFLSWVRS